MTLLYPNEPTTPVPLSASKMIPGERLPKLPDNSLWFTHDPGIFEDPVSHKYYIYSTDGLGKVSTDLINWKSLGIVVELPPKEVIDITKAATIWAPDIVYTNSEYRMYVSSSQFGTQNSYIYLAVSDKPEGPFKYSDIVYRSKPGDESNSIDANIVHDPKNDKYYLVYGSFWGGCYIKELDYKTGLCVDDSVGQCIARRPFFTTGAVEGPFVIYNSDTDYFYLFLSFGFLGTDYNIRIGRSKNINGPYLDFNDKPLTDVSDDAIYTGTMIASSYCFDDHHGWMGPGHNSVLHASDGNWYIAFHIRQLDYNFVGASTLHIRKLFFTENGWPVMSPERYAGEVTNSFTRENLVGEYERIKLEITLPQAVNHSVRYKLWDNGTFDSFSLKGEWELINETTIEFRYAGIVEHCKLSVGWDYEQWAPTIVFTGIDNKGICVWGKKLPA